MMKYLILALLFTQVTVLHGQVSGEETRYYALIDSIIEKAAVKRINVIHSVKSIGDYLDADFMMEFHAEKLRPLLASDSSWWVTMKKAETNTGATGRLDSALMDRTKVQLISDSEIRGYWRDDGFDWKKFGRKFRSDGFMEFSILFEDGDKGLLYYSIRRGPLNGGGSILFLQNINGIWMEKLSIPMWTE